MPEIRAGAVFDYTYKKTVKTNHKCFFDMHKSYISKFIPLRGQNLTEMGSVRPVYVSNFSIVICF